MFRRGCADARWVLARSTHRAHLDLGERSANSLRVQADHIIVTACYAHLDAKAPVVSESYQPKCANCQRILRAAGNAIVVHNPVPQDAGSEAG
jgi:hypothetical protein